VTSIVRRLDDGVAARWINAPSSRMSTAACPIRGVTIDATTEQTIRAASWDAVRALWADGAKPNKEATWDAAVETAIALVQDLADEA
jgi:hypothetical protein